MGVQSQLIHVIREIIWCFSLLLLAADFSGLAYRRTSAGPAQVSENIPSQAATAIQGSVDAGRSDKLLDLADNDAGQLSKVNASGRAGSHFLDRPASTVDRQANTVCKTPAAVINRNPTRGYYSEFDFNDLLSPAQPMFIGNVGRNGRTSSI